VLVVAVVVPAVVSSASVLVVVAQLLPDISHVHLPPFCMQLGECAISRQLPDVRVSSNEQATLSGVGMLGIGPVRLLP